MSEEKLLTVREVSVILSVSEKEVLDLAQKGKIPAYKVGGEYLRFKREQIDEFRKTLRLSPAHTDKTSPKYSFLEKASDYFYFNDFYILAGLLIILILFIIFKGY
jgi:excisionase family DNA binding protein